MNQLRGWPIPILATCIVHGAITMLPINIKQKNDRLEDEVITFRLVSLPQKTPSTVTEQSSYRPEKKPSPPKQMRQKETIPPSRKLISHSQGKVKEKTILPQAADDQESSIATDIAAVKQSGTGGASQMPSGPVMLSTELSVICPDMNAPTYPSASRRLGEQGELMLKLELDESGRVQKVQVTRSSGYVRLDEAAISAVKTWQCNPPLQNGQPVTVIAMQPFSFMLH